MRRRLRVFPVWALLLLAVLAAGCVGGSGDAGADSGESSSSVIKISPHSAEFWWKMVLITVLVLTGGLFAGLTIGLMSLDNNNLEVLKRSDDPQKRAHAIKIEPVRKNGHLLLCTLLLGNTIINESLPIVFDSVFEGGYLPILISTALIVIFGEIIPQAVCTRHGLKVGAQLAWLVQGLIWLFYPLAYPISRVLSWVMGDQEGVIYRRAELKELVNLHSRNALGHLSDDEVRIIGNVLELRSRKAHEIMTPLASVFMLDIDSAISRETYTEIVQRGHSRVPVYERERTNMVGMLIVKHLLVHDRDETLLVRALPLASIPVVERDMDLFTLLNHFQEGRSHMAIVCADDPTEKDAIKNHRFIGIATMEDVIEEMIGEEIIDETDVYVDMAKPSELTRVKRKYQSLANHLGFAKEHPPSASGTAAAAAGSEAHYPLLPRVRPPSAVNATSDMPSDGALGAGGSGGYMSRRMLAKLKHQHINVHFVPRGTDDAADNGNANGHHRISPGESPLGEADLSAGRAGAGDGDEPNRGGSGGSRPPHTPQGDISEAAHFESGSGGGGGGGGNSSQAPQLIAWDYETEVEEERDSSLGSSSTSSESGSTEHNNRRRRRIKSSGKSSSSSSSSSNDSNSSSSGANDGGDDSGSGKDKSGAASVVRSKSQRSGHHGGSSGRHNKHNGKHGGKKKGKHQHQQHRRGKKTLATREHLSVAIGAAGSGSEGEASGRRSGSATVKRQDSARDKILSFFSGSGASTARAGSARQASALGSQEQVAVRQPNDSEHGSASELVLVKVVPNNDDDHK